MIHRRPRFVLPILLSIGAAFASLPAHAEMGIGLRAGTFGFGVDFDLSLVEKLNLRIGYNGLSYGKDISDTDVNYEGDLKIGSVSGLLDWHVMDGSFRLSAGVVGSGPKIEVVGTPSGTNTYQIGNGTYTAAQVGSLRGEIEFGNSAAPYIGVGWGNVLSANRRFSLLVDVGVIYGGEPDVTLTAQCGTALPAITCSQLQADVQREIQELKDETNDVKWYPVISLGLGIRF
jgi:hypothetical protein